MKKISALIRMTRPANVVTAIADVLAGVTIAGRFESGLEKIGCTLYFFAPQPPAFTQVALFTMMFLMPLLMPLNARNVLYPAA